jgi:4-diphosphocytidyl-2C-methyl-D-erythritol kinase
VRLLAYVTTLGRREDIQTFRRHLGDDDLHEAPGRAQPGIFDASRSLLGLHARPLTAVATREDAAVAANEAEPSSYSAVPVVACSGSGRACFRVSRSARSLSSASRAAFSWLRSTKRTDQIEIS